MTTEIFKQAEKRILERGIQTIDFKPLNLKTVLAHLGINSVIEEKEFLALSEAEQEAHKREDFTIISCYINEQS
jgi:hypothetical protein